MEKYLIRRKRKLSLNQEVDLKKPKNNEIEDLTKYKLRGLHVNMLLDNPVIQLKEDTLQKYSFRKSIKREVLLKSKSLLKCMEFEYNKTDKIGVARKKLAEIYRLCPTEIDFANNTNIIQLCKASELAKNRIIDDERINIMVHYIYESLGKPDTKLVKVHLDLKYFAKPKIKVEHQSATSDIIAPSAGSQMHEKTNLEEANGDCFHENKNNINNINTQISPDELSTSLPNTKVIEEELDTDNIEVKKEYKKFTNDVEEESTCPNLMIYKDLAIPDSEDSVIFVPNDNTIQIVIEDDSDIFEELDLNNISPKFNESYLSKKETDLFLRPDLKIPNSTKSITTSYKDKTNSADSRSSLSCNSMKDHANQNMQKPQPPLENIELNQKKIVEISNIDFQEEYSVTNAFEEFVIKNKEKSTEFKNCDNNEEQRTSPTPIDNELPVLESKMFEDAFGLAFKLESEIRAKNLEYPKFSFIEFCASNAVHEIFNSMDFYGIEATEDTVFLQMFHRIYKYSTINGFPPWIIKRGSVEHPSATSDTNHLSKNEKDYLIQNVRDEKQSTVFAAELLKEDAIQSTSKATNSLSEDIIQSTVLDAVDLKEDAIQSSILDAEVLKEDAIEYSSITAKCLSEHQMQSNIFTAECVTNRNESYLSKKETNFFLRSDFKLPNSTKNISADYNSDHSKMVKENIRKTPPSIENIELYQKNIVEISNIDFQAEYSVTNSLQELLTNYNKDIDNSAESIDFSHTCKIKSINQNIRKAYPPLQKSEIITYLKRKLKNPH